MHCVLRLSARTVNYYLLLPEVFLSINSIQRVDKPRLIRHIYTHPSNGQIVTGIVYEVNDMTITRNDSIKYTFYFVTKTTTLELSL